MLITKKYALLISFAITIAIVLTSCERDKETFFGPIIYDEDSTSPLVTFLYDANDSINTAYNKHFKKTINYAKIPYNLLSCKTFNDACKINESTKVLVITNLKPIDDSSFEHIVEFVNSGGTVVLPVINTNDYRYHFLAGVNPEANANNLNYADGYKFTSNYIPGIKNKIYHSNIESHYGFLNTDFNDNVTVWATSESNPDYPTILKHKIGKGHVVVFNSNQPANKQERGMYFSAILSGLEGVPYPIANASAMFLDDFPAPTYDIKKEPILTEYNITHEEFYTKEWWPDMLSYADKINMKYTVMVCFNYDANTSPPYLFPEWQNSSVNVKGKSINSGDYFIRSTLKNGHELAFHGYNHTSLLKNAWPNTEYMKSSLKAVNKQWSVNDYGKAPVTYVPPSNYIDETGINALNSAMPNIKYNCSLYLGRFNEGGNREYDYEPYNNNLFNFPRISSGYILDDEAEFNILSLYMYTGIWSHFIHPDDVFQIDNKSNSKSKGNFEYRNKDNLGWVTSKNGTPGMFPRFKNHINGMKSLFPLMRFLKVQDAAKQTKEWRYSNYTHSNNGSSYKVSSKNNKLKNNYWFTYVKQSHHNQFEKHLKNKKLSFTKTECLEGYLYNIKTSAPSIEVLKLTPNIKVDSYASINKSMLKKLNAYKNIFANTSENQSIDQLVLTDELDKVIEVLMEEIDHGDITDFEQWNTLQKYLSWENRSIEVWQLLNAKFLEKKAKVWVDLSSKLKNVNYYPTRDIQELWMKRLLKFYPNDTKLKWDYYNFISEQTEKKASYLNNLCADNIIEKIKNNTIKDKATALNLLFECNSTPKIKNYLNTLSPCEDENLHAIADRITWYFADNNNSKKALEWSKCAPNISKENQNYWKLQTGDYAFLKEENLSEYINYLIINDPEKALKELQAINPCESHFEANLREDIIYLYSSRSAFSNALQWAECLPDFSIQEQLYWLIRLKKFDAFEKKYRIYKRTHPNDTDVDFLVASTYLDMGNVKKSWILASQLPHSNQLTKLQKQLNQDIQYTNTADQKYVLKHHRDFFYPKVAKRVERAIITSENPFIETHSNIVTDPNYTIGYKNNVNYGFYDKIKNTHLVGVVQNKRFPVFGFEENDTNKDHSLYGLYYGFKTNKKPKKPYFQTAFTAERDNDNRYFYSVDASLSLEKKKTYSSITLNRNPEITATAYSLKIYRTALTLFHEHRFNKRFSNVSNIEATRHTDNVYNVGLQSRVFYKYRINKHSQIMPNIELYGALGTKDNSIGLPYWSVKQRFYSGGGLRYTYNNLFNELQFSAGTSLFYDTLSSNFYRFIAEFKYPVFNYFYLNANAFVSSAQYQFSNDFNFGLTYYIK